MTLKNINKVVVGGNSVWLCLCIWWVSECVHRYIPWHAALCFNKLELTLRHLSDLICLGYCLFQMFWFLKPVCIPQKVLSVMTCYLPSRACAGRLCHFFPPCLHSQRNWSIVNVRPYVVVSYILGRK